MNSPTGLFFDHASYDAEALQTTISLVEGVTRTICIARLLLEHGRVVDMTGLDRGVGLVCARALDLPPESGRKLRPHLVSLLADSDRLTQALRETAAP